MKFYQQCKALLLFAVFSILAGPAQGQKFFYLNSAKSINWKISPDTDSWKGLNRPSEMDYPDANWINALVPGTVFNAYVVAGLEKDPNFGDNIYQVNKEKYDRDFWYRLKFIIPDTFIEEKIWLNFEGINRSGDVYLNNQLLGNLNGFMQRGKFDVTALVKKGVPNVLAVLVRVPRMPLVNLATPTYISSAGWDWMPYVPGLNSGITDDVYLSASNKVTIEDPWIRTLELNEKNAVLGIETVLNNSSPKVIEGILSVNIQPGNINLQQKVKMLPNQVRTLKFGSDAFEALKVSKPKLWWPNGYGEPNLYTANFKFTYDKIVSEEKQVKFGIKKYSYDTIGNVLHISINGKKIFVKGGNWGMSEYMLRCRGSEYDLKVKLHKEMNFNMIRNWIGSVTDDEFYQACDKYGIMVWDDFWLNSEPNLPRDVGNFNANAIEKIQRVRNHPSIAVWCGDNEGYPLPPLNNYLRENVLVFDGGDRLYQPNSHSDALTGSGPWTNAHPIWYFDKSPNGFGGEKGWGFRSEIGTAVFTTFDSFKKFMPKENWWPRNGMWDKHFFGSSGGNAGPDTYERTINSSYGKSNSIIEFCEKAQLLNIETNKALFEGWQHNMWNDASGVITWMSQSAYPSLVWQTYDYYYDLNGAYWGVKKACEPIHVQWSYADNSIKVINTTGEHLRNLSVSAAIYNIDGSMLKQMGKSATIDAPSNEATSCFKLAFDEYSPNLAHKKETFASSGEKNLENPNSATDGNPSSRWASRNSDPEWIYVDLGAKKTVNSVVLNWESAHASKYKIQVSDDAKSWKDVYENDNSKGGYELIPINNQTGRYVRVLGTSRATMYGYSLWDFEVYETPTPPKAKMNFIKLQLKDAKGKLISDNFYWRSERGADYTALNSMPPAKLTTTSTITLKNGQYKINATIINKGNTPAFAVKVQAYRKSDGERILPALMNDDYFTLLKGERKNIEITFEKGFLPDGKYTILVKPYNYTAQ
ncbi:galactose-binding domain-containing protein [Pedobacter sandarakinus]|uniref:galactose-binding domain-containing protein n=1 Tax=Pedobacter sandarakinus TaxID=353156 RepID=UPI002246695D|nr:discoidin domain-containing protein [Pedobacter sandarakinus]MCX2574118.1 discoidin domain-containing protein [Pedobacter sandarakinus]